MGSSVRRSAQCPVDRLLFLLFVRVVLPASAQEASFGRSSRGWRSVVTKTSCLPHFHCAEWCCVVLSDAPRYRIGSGTNWSVKSATRTLARNGLLGDHSWAVPTPIMWTGNSGPRICVIRDRRRYRYCRISFFFQSPPVRARACRDHWWYGLLAPGIAGSTKALLGQADDTVK